ncbi:hypothetical protein Pan153_50170 [Gimesia panareensis]|uniref:Uncharacterized protein n=2 Tax=Gimesia panareensis TaxID=2527978 RepID=A0A518FVG6_9PLAN|nr:hypothetical protein Pan153_50170 [Gimesia panareensis]
MKYVFFTSVVLIFSAFQQFSHADNSEPTIEEKKAHIKKIVSEHIELIRKGNQSDATTIDPKILKQLLKVRLKSNVRGYEKNEAFRKSYKQIQTVFSDMSQIDPQKIDMNFRQRTLEGIEGNYESFESMYHNYISKDELLKQLSMDDVIRVYINHSAMIYSRDREAWASIWGFSYIYPICHPASPDSKQLKIQITKVKASLANLSEK